MKKVVLRDMNPATPSRNTERLRDNNTAPRETKTGPRMEDTPRKKVKINLNKILEKRKLPDPPKTTREKEEKTYSRRNVDELKKSIVSRLMN